MVSAIASDKGNVHPIEGRYGSGEMRSIFQEEGSLRYWLRVEVALAKAQSKRGIIPAKASGAIAKAAKSVKINRVRQLEQETKHDLAACVRALKDLLPKEYRGYVHLGATSSDIKDTALGLQMMDALDIIEKKLAGFARILLKVAKKHRGTVCAGRTHGQQAIPITFGFKAALWLDEIIRDLERISELRRRIAVGKISGACGTYAALAKGKEVEAETLKSLGLKPANAASQVISRDLHAELLSCLTLTSCSLEKTAKEIRNLQRSEIDEVREPFETKQIGSSAMPQKRNPVISEKICGISRVIRSNCLAAFEDIALEHERDLTHSSVERCIIPETFILLDEALEGITYVFENIQVNREKMLRNILPVAMSESLLSQLTKKGMDREEAFRVLREASKDREQFGDAIRNNAEIRKALGGKGIEGALDPVNYTGLSGKIVDEVVRKAELKLKAL